MHILVCVCVCVNICLSYYIVYAIVSINQFKRSSYPVFPRKLVVKSWSSSCSWKWDWTGLDGWPRANLRNASFSDVFETSWTAKIHQHPFCQCLILSGHAVFPRSLANPQWSVSGRTSQLHLFLGPRTQTDFGHIRPQRQQHGILLQVFRQLVDDIAGPVFQ